MGSGWRFKLEGVENCMGGPIHHGIELVERDTPNVSQLFFFFFDFVV